MGHLWFFPGSVYNNKESAFETHASGRLCVWLCRRVQAWCRRVLANPLRQRPPGGPSEVGKGNLGGLTCPTRRARDAEATLSARLMHVKNRTLRWAEPWLR